MPFPHFMMMLSDGDISAEDKDGVHVNDNHKCNSDNNDNDDTEDEKYFYPWATLFFVASFKNANSKKAASLKVRFHTSLTMSASSVTQSRGKINCKNVTRWFQFYSMIK